VLPFNDVDGAVSILRRHRSDIAGILIDPMPNRAGLVPSEPAYLQALREVASEIGALLIFDEVISFRLSHGGAQALWSVEPDLTVFGKIIGGGFPIGAVGGSREIMSVFDPTHGKPPLPQGGTFSANPMSMRCGLKAMTLLDQPTFERINALGQITRDGIDAAFLRHGVSGHTTGMGSLLKVHLTERPIRDYRSAAPTAEQSRGLSALMRALLNEGVLISEYGLLALSTPMAATDIDQVVDAFDRVLHRQQQAHA
jgi:glutamate-1-semialdehyde 2,1-aminomutase